MANLELNLSNCNLFRCEVSYLGHVIAAKADVRTDPEKMYAAVNWNSSEYVHREDIQNYVPTTEYS